MANNVPRRHFLRQAACSAVGTSALVSTIMDLYAVNAAAQSASDYKALVCIFLFGGNDSSNMLVPRSGAAYADYAGLRGALALPGGTILPITPQVSDGIPHGRPPPGLRRHRLRPAPEHDRAAGALPAGARRVRPQRRDADRAGHAAAVPAGRLGAPAAALLAQRPDAAVADVVHGAQRPGHRLGRAHCRPADVAERDLAGLTVDRAERLEHLPGRPRRLPAADRAVGHGVARGLRR